jgi:hypothetical protein
MDVAGALEELGVLLFLVFCPNEQKESDMVDFG